MQGCRPSCVVLFVGPLLLAAGCPAPPPLGESGFYRCETVADCPTGWFCRSSPPDGTDLRCHTTPACTSEADPRCDDGLSCTLDDCDVAAGSCRHVLAPATCLSAGGCLDCSGMALPACGEPACSADGGTCIARPRTDGIACGPAQCAGRDAWQTAATCDGESTACDTAPASQPCPAGACEIGRCASVGGGPTCYTRVDPRPACSTAGTWWVVWTSTRPCDEVCGPVGGRQLIGGLGTLDIDDAGRGTWSAIAGGGQRSVNFDQVGVDGRLRFASDLDTDWWGRIAASGDVAVASHPDDAGLWWMVRTDAGQPALPSDLAGDWHVVLTSVGFNVPWRLVTGRVSFDASGCIKASDPVDGLNQDAEHPFGLLPVALGACATTGSGGRLRFPLFDVGRTTNAFEGTLTRGRGLGVFMSSDGLFYGPDTLVLVRVTDEAVPDLPAMFGTYAFTRNDPGAVPVEGDGGTDRAFRTEFGGATFDAIGDGAAWAWWPVGDGSYASASWSNGRARVLADGYYRIALLPESGEGLISDGLPVEPRGDWPTMPMFIAYPRAADGRAAVGALSVFVWVDDLDIDTNPLTRALVPAGDAR